MQKYGVTKRKIAAGFPDLPRIYSEHYEAEESASFVPDLVASLARLVDLPEGNTCAAVVGCGPKPVSVQELRAVGFDATGVEPVPAMLDSARSFLGNDDEALRGSAEDLPFEDGTLALVILESVLEHVESPGKSLAEAYRVLAPGGVAFVETTNRFRFHPLGRNGEYNLPFFNYYPATLKESLVHHHLHFNPKLANYTTRPAVHWFSYADLCRLGREAGFYRFYSRFDAMDAEDPSLRKKPLKRLFSQASKGPS